MNKRIRPKRAHICRGWSLTGKCLLNGVYCSTHCMTSANMPGYNLSQPIVLKIALVFGAHFGNDCITS